VSFSRTALDHTSTFSRTPIFFLFDSGDVAHCTGDCQVTIFLVAVIDDDEALGSSLVDLMRSSGYRCEPFVSAETFLLSSNLSYWDCIIADIHMPGMGGLNLIRHLRQRGFVTPVILITALPDENLDEEAISIGARCLLRKPFETTYLLDCVERSLCK
jgi:FixJ family two-component response regulator